MTQFSQADRLLRMRLLLDNLQQDAELKAAVSKVGIDMTALTEGERLYQAAEQAIDAQDALIAQLTDARSRLNKARVEAYAHYWEYAQVAQIRIKTSRLRALLELDGAREKGHNEEYQQMRRFYMAATDPEAAAALTRYGILPEELEAGRAALAAVAQLDAREARIRAHKENATEVQHAALDAMDVWHDDKLAGATYATRHKPQLMEALGKRVR